MNLQGHEFSMITGDTPDKQMNHGDADIYLSGYSDAIIDADAVTRGGDYPVLNVKIKAEECADTSTFEIRGYKDIDALRRYCEMTLEHFKAGVLE